MQVWSFTVVKCYYWGKITRKKEPCVINNKATETIPEVLQLVCVQQ